jgi:hypothetical protein
MASTPVKPPKKVKEKTQTPQERAEALRYNHMMYGPTAGEMRPVTKKVNLGSAYLKHPKFQGFMTAFKKGLAFQFEVTDKSKAYTISTDGTHILFDGKTIFYSRPLNKHEDNLLLDRVSTVYYQTNDALIHFAVAVLRALPELGSPQLTHLNQQFYYGIETLESGVAELGQNLLIGSFRHQKAIEKGRK